MHTFLTFSQLINPSLRITIAAARNAVVMEGIDIPNGWPLGLGSISTRITAEAQPAAASRLRRRSSFSSFSSSNLDTESTASFFPDQSVPLGRLIGIRVDGGNKEREKEAKEEGEEGCRQEGPSPRHNSEGICTPLARIFRRPKHFHALISQ